MDFRFKVKSSAMKILDLTSQQYDMSFVYGVLNSIKFKPDNHQRHWISIFSNFNMLVPENDEQNKIGELLRNLDNIIIFHQRKLENLELIKKYFMKNMFV